VSLIERRRSAIALVAAAERAHATFLEEQVRVTAPQLRDPAAWLKQRLAEIEPFFLTRAEQYPELAHAWLDAAERWLEFYICELRRLEERAAVPTLETRH